MKLRKRRKEDPVKNKGKPGHFFSTEPAEEIKNLKAIFTPPLSPKN